jgi:hypothetical protein
MHPQDCTELKARRHQLDPMRKKVNDVASGAKVNPRTRNIESDHRGRLGQSRKNEKNEKTIEPGQRSPVKEEKRE